MPTNSGLVQDVEAIGQICREEEILYLVDACQSAGQMPLDVNAIHCDFLSATYRKFLRGPRGTGFLYVSDRVLQQELCPVFLDLHSAIWSSENEYTLVSGARRFEIWERPYALCLGAKVATEYALKLGLDQIRDQVVQLADYTRGELQKLPKLRVLDKGTSLCGIATFTSDEVPSDVFKSKLEAARINTSTTFFDYARIDLGRKNARWAMRISPHYYNLQEEIDKTMEGLKECVG